MNVEEIVKEVLKAQGYDGLSNKHWECYCLLADLAPCNEMHGDCRAGYKVPCPPECGEGHDFHVVEGEPEQFASTLRPDCRYSLASGVCQVEGTDCSKCDVFFKRTPT